MRVKYEASKAAKHAAFPYQLEAVRSIRDLEFAAVFHEQGLGKTKIALDLGLTWLKEGTIDSVLILTKKSLVQNWRDEIAFHTHFEARILDQDRRSNYYALNSPARFYVAHYEVCLSEQKRLEVFLRTRRVAVVCDEAQKFKNPHGRIAKALYQLAPCFTKRLVMTGTPVANRPYDIWSLIRFLDGGASLGADFEEFKAEFDLDPRLAHDRSYRLRFEQNLASMFDRIKHFAVRETKRTAGIVLPNKEVIDVNVELEGRQEELYRLYRDELRSVIIKDGVPVFDDVENVVKRLLRLVQIASNPALVDESYSGTPAKLPALEEILQSAFADPTAKAIVWTNFTENADWLAKQLKRHGTVRVHGQLSIDERNRGLDHFKKDPHYRVLVATPGAAKEGLTLTVANHAVFYDRSLSLDDYLQAQDRIHRLSQKRTCFIYNLVAQGTVDDWVEELLLAKHLAAQLALGDVDITKYQNQATYSFVEALKQVLEA